MTQTPNNPTIRPILPDEIPLLKDFLYEAIFIPEGSEAPARDIVERPELRIYTDDFGSREGDHCLVAEADGKVVGAIWSRIMDDYGHVDDDTPSLAISLYPEYRGQGIGTRLMTRMLELLKQQGYGQVSLAVQRANRAVRMYERAGFRTVGENDEEYIMVREMKPYKILFICFGNICRSAMAEFLFRHLVHERGLDDSFEIASAAASDVSVGKPLEPRAREQLVAHGIPCKGHIARQMTMEDYHDYDMILCMDLSNLRDLCRLTNDDPDNKISLLLEHAGRQGDEVADPWYTHDFDTAWNEIKEGCEGLLEELT